MVNQIPTTRERRRAMKKILITLLVSLSLVAWGLQASAAPPETPKPGLKVVEPPGSWNELLPGGQEGQPGNIINASLFLNNDPMDPAYTFTAVLQTVESANDPYWIFKTTYINGTLKIWNKPGTPWYNKKAPVGPYQYGNITVVNLTWKDAGDIEFLLVGYYQGQVIITGGYSGVLNIGSFNGIPGIYGDLDFAKVNCYPQNRNKP
jgi:hypothetical protein